MDKLSSIFLFFLPFLLFPLSFTLLPSSPLTVDSVTATMETVITNNALVCHRVHRHEPPVTDEPLRVMHEDEYLVVINKPASIPVSRERVWRECGGGCEERRGGKRERVCCGGRKKEEEEEGKGDSVILSSVVTSFLYSCVPAPGTGREP